MEEKYDEEINLLRLSICSAEKSSMSDENSIMQCKKCGFPLEQDATFCGNCGTKVE